MQQRIPNFVFDSSDCFDEKTTTNKQTKLVLMGYKISKNQN